MRKKAPDSEVNLLELIPVKHIEWEIDRDGLITLLKPKYRHPFLTKYLLPRLKRPFYQVNLDEIGSYFWENCDGIRSVKQIAKLQKEKFGEKVEPLYDRIAIFIQTLERNRFIKLKRPS